MKIYEFQNENHENNKNQRIPLENHEHHENLKVTCE